MLTTKVAKYVHASTVQVVQKGRLAKPLSCSNREKKMTPLENCNDDGNERHTIAALDCASVLSLLR